VGQVVEPFRPIVYLAKMSEARSGRVSARRRSCVGSDPNPLFESRDYRDYRILRPRSLQWLDSRAGALATSRHREVKHALGYAPAWDELSDLNARLLP
jgi:hypothetical protein